MEQRETYSIDGVPIWINIQPKYWKQHKAAVSVDSFLNLQIDFVVVEISAWLVGWLIEFL